jgi:hypothetical protein
MSAPKQPVSTSGAASRRAFRQTLWFTVAAVVLYAGIRNLPADRSTLHYTDFHAGGASMLEFCAPGGPQFVPVDRVRSPVTMTLAQSGPPGLDGAIPYVVTLTSGSGKPVTVDDLLVVHTEKLHLLLVDPSLEDYQHLHPVGLEEPGTFAFEFSPRRSGTYRVFADFTPRATGRALYAGASLDVGSRRAAVDPVPAGTSDRAVEVAGYTFAVGTDSDRVRINEISELRLAVARAAGGPVHLEDIMGAQAHVVAFDAGRTGFAHLHPLVGDGKDSPSDQLSFQLLLSDPGHYRLWVQVKIEGREIFAPFDFDVQP